MTKQRLENDFRDLLKQTDFWWHKFYHIAGAYTDVPADFIVLGVFNNVLIECKQCKGNSFALNRYTQRGQLNKFITCKTGFSLKRAYVLICFWRGRKDKSLYYMLDVGKFEKIILDISPKKSLNITDLNKVSRCYKYDELKEIIMEW